MRGDFVPHNGLDRGARRAVVRAVLRAVALSPPHALPPLL